MIYFGGMQAAWIVTCNSVTVDSTTPALQHKPWNRAFAAQAALVPLAYRSAKREEREVA